MFLLINKASLQGPTYLCVSHHLASLLTKCVNYSCLKSKACFVPYNRNSEIYNHDEIKAKHLPGVRIVKDSKSDSAIIGHLYQACHPPAPCYDHPRFACVDGNPLAALANSLHVML